METLVKDTTKTPSEYGWVNEDSEKYLYSGYITEDETPAGRFDEIAEASEYNLGDDPAFKGFAQRFKKYMKKGYYALSSPVISNFGKPRGYPISCFGSYIGDSISDIGDGFNEMLMMSKMGGGTSGYWGGVRGMGAEFGEDGGITNGPLSFMKMYDTGINGVSQGSVRRGAYATYLDIDHSDVEEFLKIKAEGNDIQNLNFGLCVPDYWMKEMIAGDRDKQTLWGKVIQKKFETGFPYIFFSGNANKSAPQVYKDKGMTIWASNLCTEIMLATSKEESFVCDLGHINLSKWNEIKAEPLGLDDVFEVLSWHLDAVMTEFIRKSEGCHQLDKARRFAINQRAIGVGVVGYHSYLQQENIAYESMEAKFINKEIFSTMSASLDKSSRKLAAILGEPPLLKGYGIRWVTNMTIAPTTSSSFILGQITPAADPSMSNYFTKDLAKGKFTFKSPTLTKVLKSYGKDTKDVWKSILTHGGSAQHLDFLTQHERNVYKTCQEISQMEIVVQAAQRQSDIDQGQSLNLVFASDTPAREVNKVLIYGWEHGIKSFYYQRGTNPAQEIARNISSCASCEG